MSSIALVYAVMPSETVARTIAKSVVADGLAACANILPPCISIYEWDGEMQESEEIPLILKTTSACADKLIAQIEAMHPYSNPAILSWPIVRAPAAFTKWVNDQTQD